MVEKIKKLPNSPNIISRWIKKNLEILYIQFNICFRAILTNGLFLLDTGTI